jgi:hypothetical protein
MRAMLITVEHEENNLVFNGSLLDGMLPPQSYLLLMARQEVKIFQLVVGC